MIRVVGPARFERATNSLKASHSDPAPFTSVCVMLHQIKDLAFAGLIITILIQARELRLQRQQLTLQRSELEGQHTELARLANAQDAQNYALLVSAFAAAEVFEQRNTSAAPSPEFAEAIRYLRAHMKEETARRQ